MNYSNSVFDSPGVKQSPYGSRSWADSPLKRREVRGGDTNINNNNKNPVHDSGIHSKLNRENISDGEKLNYFNNQPQQPSYDSKNDKNRQNSKKRNYNTLIPTHILDVGRQRSFVFAIGFLLFCYKLYDLLLMKLSNPQDLFKNQNLSRFGFLSKYFIMDTLYLYFLPVFRIPKLTFKPFVTYSFIAIALGINYFISSDQFIPFLKLLVTAWATFNPKKIDISGDSVNYNKVIDSSSHFKGKHIIKILPENTALLNPFRDSFCLSEKYGVYNVQIPIRVNSTTDVDFLQIEYTDLYTNEKSLLNVSTTSLQKKGKQQRVNEITKILKNDEKLKFLNRDLINNDEKSDNIQYYNVTVNKPGSYQLVQMIDKENFQLRLYKSALVIPECPLVNFEFENPLVNSVYDRCLGSDDNVTIKVTGVPPLKLQYGKISGDGNNNEIIIDDTSLQPVEFLNGNVSPLMTNQVTNTNKRFSKEDLLDLKWATPYSVEVNLKSISQGQGLHGYHIYQVVDGFGNAIARDLLVKSDSVLDYEYYIHGEPKASLSDKFNAKSSSKRSLVVKLDDFQSSNYKMDAPFDVEILYRTNERDDIEIMHHQLKTGFMEIMAERSGEYVLNRVQSKFCPGIVLGDNKVVVTEPIAPEMTVESSPILDQCAGTVGLDFNLVFTGVAPFEFTTKIYKIDPKTKQKNLYESKKRRSTGTRHQFSFNPSQVGDYEIEFVDVANTVFDKPVRLQPSDNYIFKTSMRVKPGAQIVKGQSHHQHNRLGEKKLCLNSSTTVSVDLRGQSPFTLKYDITETNSNERISYVEENIMGNSIQLITPSFMKGGNYIFSLASIKDTTGCSVPINNEEITFQVRRMAPSAEFNFVDMAHQHVVIKKGDSARVPMRVMGDAPFQIGYALLSPDGKSYGPVKHATISSKTKPELELYEQGIYKLVSVQDNTCKGFISGADTFEISYLTPPRLQILDHSSNKITKISESKYLKKDVCQNVERLIEMKIDGLAPLNVTYDVIMPNGQVLKNQYLQVLTNYATITLPNEESGEYKVIIKNVNDMNYPSNVNMKPIEIVQNVYKTPNLKIYNKNGGKSFRTCYSNIDEPSAYLEPIQLKHVSSNSRGVFKVTFKIFHETSGKTEFLTLNTEHKEETGNILNVDYKQIYGVLKMGSYTVTIHKIVDSVTGCVGRDLSLSSFTITLTDVPTISLLEPSLDYCVGDYVTYQLNGQTPFEIKYAFNKKQLKTTEHSSQFVRLASEAGDIFVNSIQDTQAKCLVNFNKPGMEKQFEALSLKIHEKPTVTVSQGDIYEEDIHEGDQAEIIFTFEGEMPFQLKYVRMENDLGIVGETKNNIEIFTVTDIFQYEYRIVTSLQGTYEAIEISDRYCTARNEAFFK